MSRAVQFLIFAPFSSSKLTHQAQRLKLPLRRSSMPCNCMGVGGQPETKLSHTSKRERELHVAGVTTTIPLTATQSEEESSNERIFLSDVVVKRRENVYLGRKWTLDDVATAMMMGIPHVLCLFYPFVATRSSAWVGIGITILTGFGICLSYHRNLSHRSFKLVKWVEYFFAYCGVMALQKDPIYWASTHRKHHMHTDTLRDPHTPKEGFWFSHMGWRLDNDYLAKKHGGVLYDNVADLQKQPFYMFLHRTYYAHPIAFALLLYAVGGFPYVVAVMGVGRVITHHCTFILFSACHIWGQRPWNTPDNSKNIWWAAILTLGESWHNNHHAFEYSARVGLEWWQIDTTWYLIKFLEFIGLASDIKLPSEAHKRALAKKTTDTNDQAQSPLVCPAEVRSSNQAQSPPVSLNGATVGL